MSIGISTEQAHKSIGRVIATSIYDSLFGFVL